MIIIIFYLGFENTISIDNYFNYDYYQLYKSRTLKI